MKSVIVAVLLLASCLSVHAQVYKFRAFEATKYSPKEKHPKLVWRPTDALIVLNSEAQKIVIYTDDEQQIDIVKSGDLDTKPNGDMEWFITGVDKEGIKLTVAFFSYNNGGKVLVLGYANVTYMYRMRSNE